MVVRSDNRTVHSDGRHGTYGLLLKMMSFDYRD